MRPGFHVPGLVLPVIPVPITTLSFVYMMIAAFFDVDGTLTTTRVWQGLMDYFSRHGLRRATHFAFLLYHYPLYFLRRLGLISEAGFRAPWAAHLGWYLRGYRLEDAASIWDWVVKEHVSRHWRNDIRVYLDQHLQAGHVVVLVSGGPLPLLERIAQELNVPHVVGTRFEISNGHYTGRIASPVCIDHQKALQVRAYLEGKRIPVDYRASYAYADSISDLPLFELVGQPRAVYPDAALRKLSQERDWQILP